MRIFVRIFLCGFVFFCADYFFPKKVEKSISLLFSKCLKKRSTYFEPKTEGWVYRMLQKQLKSAKLVDLHVGVSDKNLKSTFFLASSVIFKAALPQDIGYLQLNIAGYWILEISKKVGDSGFFSINLEILIRGESVLCGSPRACVRWLRHISKKFRAMGLEGCLRFPCFSRASWAGGLQKIP